MATGECASQRGGLGLGTRPAVIMQGLVLPDTLHTPTSIHHVMLSATRPPADVTAQVCSISLQTQEPE